MIVRIYRLLLVVPVLMISISAQQPATPNFKEINNRAKTAFQYGKYQQASKIYSTLFNVAVDEEYLLAGALGLVRTYIKFNEPLKADDLKLQKNISSADLTLERIPQRVKAIKEMKGTPFVLSKKALLIIAYWKGRIDLNYANKLEASGKIDDSLKKVEMGLAHFSNAKAHMDLINPPQEISDLKTDLLEQLANALKFRNHHKPNDTDYNKAYAIYTELTGEKRMSEQWKLV